MPSNESVKKALSLIEADKSKVLGVTTGKHTVEPGLYVPRADAQQPPTLSFAVPDASKTYLAVGLDIDAPFPSFPKLGPILHWIQGGFKASTDGSNTLATTAPFIANYIGPAPPPGSSPHRYVFFLYEEPAGLDPKAFAPANGATLGNGKRMWASLDDWESKLKLGSVLAVNYFTSN